MFALVMIAALLAPFPASTGPEQEIGAAVSLVVYSDLPSEELFDVAIQRGGSIRVFHRSSSSPGKQRVDSETTVDITVARVKELEDLALSATDFLEGCGEVAHGTNAKLVVWLADNPVGRHCKNSPRWPSGAKTQAFVAALNSHLPDEFKVH